MAIRTKRTVILEPDASEGYAFLELTFEGESDASRVIVQLNDGAGNRADVGFGVGELRALVAHLKAEGIDLAATKVLRDGCNCGLALCADCGCSP